MKRISQVIIFLIVLLGGQSLTAQEIYSGKVLVKQNRADVSNDTVYLEMEINIIGLEINSRESLSLYPVLSADKDSLTLPPVILNGAAMQRKADRAIRLKGSYTPQEKAFVVLRNEPEVHRTIVYRDTLTYRPWMKTAGLKLNGIIKDQNEKTLRIISNKLTPGMKLSN